MAAHARSPERLARAQEQAARDDAAAELLDAAQMQMLESLAERIVPGAAAAGCARFIDSLAAVGERDDARDLLSALGAIDAEARDRFGSAWLDLAEAQQTELLDAASTGEPGRTPPAPWEPGTPLAEYFAAQRERFMQPRRVTLRDRFDTVKGWVVGAYYSSEPGLWELGYTGMSFGAPFKACSHPGGHG
jgi:hypothetical protein